MSRFLDRSLSYAFSRYGDHVAVVDELGGVLTYSDLWRRSGPLARKLEALGITEGASVILHSSKGLSDYIALVACLRSQVAVLTLDPMWPLELRSRCVTRLGPAAVIDSDLPTGRGAAYGLPVLDPICTDRRSDIGSAEPARILAGSVLYASVTSGSTGDPRVVLVGTEGVDYLIEHLGSLLGVDSSSNVSQSAPLFFDAAWQQILLAWCNGGTLVAVPDLVKAQPQEMLNWLDGRVITHWDSVPSLWYPIVDAMSSPETRVESLEAVVLAGEVVSPTYVRRWRSALPGNPRLFNIYGPTEATIDATAYEISQQDLPETIPIGDPLPMFGAYVLDSSLKRLRVGEAGTLYLTGPGLATGYAGDPGGTARAFVPNPFGPPGSRMYCTGDRVLQTPDGLVFAGRTDRRVKRYGVIVDLDILEAVLEYCGGVSPVVAIYCETCKTLFGYYTDELASGWRARFAAKVPSSGYPNQVIRLSEFPRLPNGKIDRKGITHVCA